jgi:heme-degrading monooxygenase HmoA
MFARHVSLHLKANNLKEFTQIFDQEVVPLLRKQPGFQDAIAFSLNEGMDVIAISLWDTKASAEAYNTTGYPQALTSLSKVADGTPRVRISNVLSSTLHKTIEAVVAA